MTKTLSLSEVKLKFSQLVDGVVKKDDEIVITRNGRPVAVLVNADEFDSWKETHEIRSDAALAKEFRKGLKAYRSGKTKRYKDSRALLGLGK